MEKKNIVIIGAGPGLGYHIAEEFGNQGFRTILMSRREDVLKQYVTKLNGKSIEADCQVVDCANNESIKSALSKAQQKYGDIDVLVYNTAVLQGGSPLELTPEELSERYQVDVSGALCAVQQVVPGMKDKKDGTILFTGGGLALNPMPESTSISVHKAALRALAIVLHKELKDTGVYAGIVNIKGGIGSDDYYSPDKIAKLFYRLYEERNEMEITY